MPPQTATSPRGRGERLDDIALIACGGASFHILEEGGFDTLPVIHIDPRQAALSGEPGLSTPLAAANRDALVEALTGKRVVFIFTILGGTSGTKPLTDISWAAKQVGCKVVSLLMIPWAIEAERRSRAMEALPQAIDISDRAFLLDIQTMISQRMEKDPKVHFFYNITSYVMRFAMNCLIRFVEGPFFSTFMEHVYTFSYVNVIDPCRAVEVAMKETVFPTDPSCGRLVIAVSREYENAQIEQMYRVVTEDTGIIPDIVKREDREDTKVVVFLPVRF